MPTLPAPKRKSYLPKREVQGRRIHANTEFYQGRHWRRVRALYLQQHPLCAECQREGRVVAARVVDHIKPINEGGARYDFRNLQGLCDKCHNKKSGREAHKRGVVNDNNQDDSTDN